MREALREARREARREALTTVPWPGFPILLSNSAAWAESASCDCIRKLVDMPRAQPRAQRVVQERTNNLHPR